VKLKHIMESNKIEKPKKGKEEHKNIRGMEMAQGRKR